MAPTTRQWTSDDPFTVFKNMGPKDGVEHPVNQLRLLLRKHGFNGGFPVLSAGLKPGHYRMVIEAKENPPISGKWEPYEMLAVVAHEVDKIPGLTLDFCIGGQAKYWEVGFMLDQFLEENRPVGFKPEIKITPGVKLSPTMSFKERPAQPASSRPQPAAFVPSAGMPENVQERVKALLEQKRTASPDQQRKIRQQLRKLGYFISQER